jgi:hypothetical protein
MSITSTPAKGTRKRQHPSGDDNKEEQSSTKRQRPTFLSWVGRGFLGFFGGSALNGSQSHDGIVDNNIGNNGHEAVYANEDDATNHQSQLDDVNADHDANSGASANGTRPLHDCTNTFNIQCPDAPIKSREVRLHGYDDSTESDEEDEEDDFNDALQQYTTKLRQQSAAKLGFQELQLLQEEEDRIEVSEELRRELDQKEYEEEKEQLQQFTEDNNWEREARDAFDAQTRQEEEDGYNELQRQKEEEEQHEMIQAELERSLRGMIDDDSNSSDEEENQADTIEEDDVTEQRSNEEEVTTKNDRQVETDEAYARALQHQYDDEKSRKSQQEKSDAAFALVLQNECSPHAREISSSTDPSRFFSFKDPQQEEDEQLEWSLRGMTGDGSSSSSDDSGSSNDESANDCAEAMVAAIAVVDDEDISARPHQDEHSSDVGDSSSGVGSSDVGDEEEDERHPFLPPDDDVDEDAETAAAAAVEPEMVVLKVRPICVIVFVCSFSWSLSNHSIL